MQLKSLANTTNALHEITTVFADTTLDLTGQKAALTAIGKAYTLETLKAAIAQSTLNQAQIEAILTANGLQGELLETTVNELVLAQAQKKVTASTLGLGTAFKGLLLELKKVTASLWAFLTTNPVGWLTLVAGAFAAAAFGVKKYNDHTDADAAIVSHLLCPCFYPRNLPPPFTPENYLPRTVSAADHGSCFVRIRERKTSRP